LTGYINVHIGNMYEVNIEYLPKKITADNLIYILVKETVDHSEFIVSCGRNFSERKLEEVCQKVVMEFLNVLDRNFPR